jgi:hypothetical protein
MPAVPSIIFESDIVYKEPDDPLWTKTATSLFVMSLFWGSPIAMTDTSRIDSRAMTKL